MSVEWRLKYTNTKKNFTELGVEPKPPKTVGSAQLEWMPSFFAQLWVKKPVNSNLKQQKNLTKQNWHREKVSGPAHPHRKENAVVPGDRFRSIFPKTISRTNNN